MLRTSRPGLLDEWMTYWEAEPFGNEWRPQMEILAALLNQNLSSDGTPIIADQLMPGYRPPTEEEQEAMNADAILDVFSEMNVVKRPRIT